MASGDPVVQVLAALPPAANAAQETVRVGGSTPGENVRVWAFDDTTTEYMDFLCQLRGYDGGGLTLHLHWSAASATAGEVAWEAAVRRVADDLEDIDGAHTYDFNQAAAAGVTAPSAAGELGYDTIAFTDGADMDSWADGETAVVRVRRNLADADDDMVGDAQLWALTGVET